MRNHLRSIAAAMAFLLTPQTFSIQMPSEKRTRMLDDLVPGPFAIVHGFAPTYARPCHKGRGAAADRRAANKRRGIRTHRQRIGMKP